MLKAPAFSSTGPEVILISAPNSLAIISEREVLPRPGVPRAPGGQQGTAHDRPAPSVAGVPRHVYPNLEIEDATVRTRILEAISEILGRLNRARAVLAAPPPHDFTLLLRGAEEACRSLPAGRRQDAACRRVLRRQAGDHLT